MDRHLRFGSLLFARDLHTSDKICEAFFRLLGNDFISESFKGGGNEGPAKKREA